MFQGNTKAAIHLITENNKGRVLLPSDLVSPGDPASSSVLDALKSKHPTAQPLSCDAIYSPDSPPPNVHPVIFEELDTQCIRSAALRTTGAGAPSSTDALFWRRLCTSFKRSSDELCYSLSCVAKQLCSSFVDPEGLSALLACRLVALDKNPGVCPIGICETVQCIIAKAALQITRQDIQEAAGSLQLCAGQPSGVEASIHAVRTAFEDTSCDCVLLVDATNAFNSLNHLTALHNILHTCPALAKIIINRYRSASYLFVCGSELKLEEGTRVGQYTGIIVISQY